jgi:hypothetical protein
MAEYRGFVFAIVFIIIFAGLLSSVPTDLYGQGNTPNIVTPVDPALVTDFDSYVNWSSADFYPVYASYQYEYSFISRTWVCDVIGGGFSLGAKIYYAGYFFIGSFDMVNFISPTGVNIGTQLSFDQIDADADNGTVRYDLQYVTGGSSAGALVLYWNVTEYADSSYDAYVGDGLYFLHGAGVSSTARMDIGALLISLLLLQLPDCPPLINLLLATLLYASVIYLIWFIIKETIPFV